MKRLLILFSVLLSFITLVALNLEPQAKESSEPHLVFAHFHMPFAPNGASVDGYKQDIREARAAGLDGFVLNIVVWSTEDGNWYKKRTAMMFQAAKESDPAFKLMISTDECCGMTAADHLDIIRTYIHHPNYFHKNGRPVLCTWGGEAKGGDVRKAHDWWRNEVLEPARKEGFNIFFVPFFYTADYNETPSYENLKANWDGTAITRKSETIQGWWKEVVDGLFFFAATGLPVYGVPRSILDSGEAYARLLRENGRLFMGGVSPLYWGNIQKNGRRYFEYRGGEGLAAQWNSIIHVQKPEWIELFTWNDFTEASYFSPSCKETAHGSPSQKTDYDSGYFPSHKGFTDLNRYYIDWFKTDKQPPIKTDRIFWFYRTHPKAAVAEQDMRGPVTEIHGELRDEVYITSLLTAPAELTVNAGG